MVETQIQNRECFFWRVEDGTNGLLRWLDKQGLVDAEKIKPAQMFANTRYNHKHGPKKVVQLEDIHPNLIWPLQDQMRRYGYNRWE